MKLFHDWLTGPDNDNFEMWRAMAGASFVIGMGLVIYSVGWRDQSFDLEEFAWGVSIFLLGASGGTSLKDYVASRSKRREPEE